MENKKYPKTDAKRRELKCYPPEKYFTLVKGYAYQNEESESKAMQTMIRCFFDNMNAEERMRYLKIPPQQLQQRRPSQNRY